MTKIRNKSFVKQVLIRDLGLCRCCGLKGSEVHHIIPLIYGGEDKVTNMITLCYTCHVHSPDNKKDFYEYMIHGGARTRMMMGICVEMAFDAENKTNGALKANELINLGRMMIRDLRKMDYNWALENNNLKDSLEVEDIDFSECIFKDKQNEQVNKGEEQLKV